jgi:hypothetical protein
MLLGRIQMEELTRHRFRPDTNFAADMPGEGHGPFVDIEHQGVVVPM